MKLTAFPESDEIWEVVSYGRTLWNHQAPDSPLVEICIINASVKSDYRVLKVGLLDLPLVPIGSYWHQQEMISEPIWHARGAEVRHFTLDSDNSFFINAYKLESSNPNRYIIPPFKYAIPKEFRGTKFLVATSDDAIQVLIPSLTIFSRMYGLTSAFKKAFLNGTLNQSLNQMRYRVDLEKLENKPEDGQYPIGLKTEIHDKEALWVYLLETSSYVSSIHRNIRWQLHRSRANGGYIEFPLYFPGKVSIVVEGVDISTPGKSKFLVQNILASDLPPAPSFFRDRENTSNVSKGAVTPDNDKKSWPGGATPPSDEKPENTGSLNSTKPSNSKMKQRQFESPPIKILGDLPEMTAAIRKEKVTGGSRPVPQEDTNEFSNAENDDSKATGKGKSNLSTPIECTEVTQAIWNKLVSMRAAGDFFSIKSLVVARGNISEAMNVMMLTPFPQRGDWSYHGGNRLRPRHLLVAEVKTKSCSLTLFEIEPRLNRRGKISVHQGCICNRRFEARELEKIIEALCDEKGVWKRLSKELLGEHRTYKHSENQKAIERVITEFK